MKPEFWCNKRVFLTGHTGFKGGWLALWLSSMGAKVYGYALAPPTTPNFFTVCKLQDHLAQHTQADIRDLAVLVSALQQSQADIVFHLAAQPLVRDSYIKPIDTYMTNVIGTVNVLEAVRKVTTVKAIVNITTDKCYENHEWEWAYRENEPLGGHDPYSSSKACAELVTTSYRRSFLQDNNIQLATARAGNVIGGGDWAKDRLIPDFLRAIDAHKVLTIRSPNAIRPWQHVLEPLSGYIHLAELLFNQRADFAEAWNFGPNDLDVRSVQWIVEYLCQKIPEATWQLDKVAQPHEAHSLRLDSSKAKIKLGWQPRWNIDTALSQTLDWHLAWKQNANMTDFSLKQIRCYERSIK